MNSISRRLAPLLSHKLLVDKFQKSNIRTRAQQCFEQVKHYFRPKEEPVFVTTVKEEPAFELAKRRAREDRSFVRVYPLLYQLSDEERLQVARLAITEFAGETISTPTDCCNFIRHSLSKFDLNPTDELEIFSAVNKQSDGRVMESLVSQYGIKPPKSQGPHPESEDRNLKLELLNRINLGPEGKPRRNLK